LRLPRYSGFGLNISEEERRGREVRGEEEMMGILNRENDWFI